MYRYASGGGATTRDFGEEYVDHRRRQRRDTAHSPLPGGGAGIIHRRASTTANMSGGAVTPSALNVDLRQQFRVCVVCMCGSTPSAAPKKALSAFEK